MQEAENKRLIPLNNADILQYFRAVLNSCLVQLQLLLNKKETHQSFNCLFNRHCIVSQHNQTLPLSFKYTLVYNQRSRRSTMCSTFVRKIAGRSTPYECNQVLLFASNFTQCICRQTDRRTKDRHMKCPLPEKANQMRYDLPNSKKCRTTN